MNLSTFDLLSLYPSIILKNLKGFKGKKTIKYPFPHHFDLNVTPGVLGGYLLINTPEVSMAMNDTCTIFNVFKDNVLTSPVLQLETREFLLNNSVFIILMVLASIDKYQLKDFVSEYFIDYEDTNYRYVVQTFIGEFREIIVSAYEDVGLKDKICMDIIHVYSYLYSIVLYEQTESFKQLTTEIEPIPSYVPEPFRQRLYILSLFPNYSQIAHALQQAESPKMFLLTYRIKNRILTKANVLQMFKFLPDVFNVKSVQCLNEFNERVWCTDISPSPMMRRCLPDYKHGKTPARFTKRVLLLQMIVLVGTDNWAELWRFMGWPLSFEIQKRLWFLKEQEKWLPNAIHITDCILSYN